jgi:DNA repair exonuclease SbcCD ATPase subunit
MSSDSAKNSVMTMLLEVKGDKVTTPAALVKAIKNMMTRQEKDQDEHAKIHKKMMKQCMEEKEFRKKEIKNAEDSLKRAMAHQAKCQKSLDSAKEALPQLKSTKKEYEAELKRATEVREKEHKAYLVRKENFKEALDMLNDFKKYVEGKFKGHFKAFSFAEISSKVLKHSSSLGRLTEAVPVLAQIAALAPKHHNYEYKANESVAQKLKEALDKLLEILVKDNDKNEKTEAKLQEIFDKYKQRLEKAIAKLGDNIKRTEKQIREMNKCVNVEKKISGQASAKLNRNGTLKKNAEKMCLNFNAEFIKATKNRLEIISTIRQVLKIVAKRFKQLPKDLVDYLDKVQDGWIKYVNSTEFHAYVEYQRTHVANSKHGETLATKKALK